MEMWQCTCDLITSSVCVRLGFKVLNRGLLWFWWVFSSFILCAVIVWVSGDEALWRCCCCGCFWSCVLVKSNNILNNIRPMSGRNGVWLMSKCRKFVWRNRTNAHMTSSDGWTWFRVDFCSFHDLNKSSRQKRRLQSFRWATKESTSTSNGLGNIGHCRIHIHGSCNEWSDSSWPNTPNVLGIGIRS